MIRPYNGRDSAPPPPPELMAEIGAAAAAGDKPRQAAAEATYRAWAEQQGWVDPATERADLGWLAEHEAKEDQ